MSASHGRYAEEEEEEEGEEEEEEEEEWLVWPSGGDVERMRPRGHLSKHPSAFDIAASRISVSPILRRDQDPTVEDLHLSRRQQQQQQQQQQLLQQQQQ